VTPEGLATCVRLEGDARAVGERIGLPGAVDDDPDDVVAARRNAGVVDRDGP
jgi:hypothetical protein